MEGVTGSHGVVGNAGVRDFSGNVLSSSVFQCLSLDGMLFPPYPALFDALAGLFTGGAAGTQLAAVSLAVGLFSLIFHQFATFGTNTEFSLWALPPSRQLFAGEKRVKEKRRRMSLAALSEGAGGFQDRWRTLHLFLMLLYFTLDVTSAFCLYQQLIFVFSTTFISPTIIGVGYVILAMAVKAAIVSGGNRVFWLRCSSSVRSAAGSVSSVSEDATVACLAISSLEAPC